MTTNTRLIDNNDIKIPMLKQTQGIEDELKKKNRIVIMPKPNSDFSLGEYGKREAYDQINENEKEHKFDEKRRV